MITEDYVSFETAKLLKEKGFHHWSYKCYGTAVYHKGVPISFDEECDLKSEGLEDEIEYVEGGYLYDFGCDNRKKDAKVWAAPTLQVALKWIQEVYNIIIVADYEYECTDTSWYFKVYRLGENGKPDRVPIIGVSYDKDNNPTEHIVGYRDYKRGGKEYATKEEAEEDGIKYVLENMIEKSEA